MQTSRLWILALILLCPSLAAVADAWPRAKVLVEREACAAGVPVEYATAIAQASSGFDPAWRGRNGGTGIMAVLPELAAPYLDKDTSWLDYPPTNVRVAMHIMADLLETHGDWETVLTIYFRGRESKSFASRRWVNRVFKEVDRTVRPVQRPLRPSPGNLDDFGPRRSSGPQTDWLRQSPHLQRTDGCRR